ncbi:hypothetical protein Bpfe_001655 [Biomphalaria pfeifferi]|uniref:Uncharacterized protein n=1 Tax=Biomphalaria pfeifferi TaxID=112525 RepID=A0AAD8C9Y9_BIOPF|nr:hypothetical protein Bpfe_001655 [Biomphalaria pfeifferi]
MYYGKRWTKSLHCGDLIDLTSDRTIKTDIKNTGSPRVTTVSFHDYDGSVRLTRFCDVCRITCRGGGIHLYSSVVQYCTLYRYMRRTANLLHAIGPFIMAPKRKADTSDPKEKDAAKKWKAITVEVTVDIIRRSDKGGNTDRNWQVITT